MGLLGGNDDLRIAKNLLKEKKEGECTCERKKGYIDMKSGRPEDVLRTMITFILGIIIVILIWAFFAWYFNDLQGTSVLKFPTPSETFERLYEYLFLGNDLFGYSIYVHIAASLKRWLIAFALAMVVGLTLGSILGYFTKIYSIGMVPVSVFQMIPGLAWLPVALLIFGLGDDSAVFIIFAVSSMVITIGVAGGIRSVPEVIVRASKMMGANNPVMFTKILIPYAVVDIINGLRVGMSSAWRVLIAAEMVVGTGVGLGYSIELARDLLNFVGAFACVIIICAIGLLVDKVVFDSIERYARHRLGMEEGY